MEGSSALKDQIFISILRVRMEKEVRNRIDKHIDFFVREYMTDEKK